MTNRIEITLAQLWEALDPKYKWIAKDKDGSIYVYTDKPIVVSYEWRVSIGSSESLSSALIEIVGFETDCWLNWIVKRPAPEPDYSRWVGRLCWFRDDSSLIESVGILRGYCPEDEDKFNKNDYGQYRYCRPLTRAEALILVVREDGDE